MLIARLLLLLLLVAGAACRAQETPRVALRVVDRAEILSDAAEAELTSKIEALERLTTDQLVVVTTPGLNDETIEAFALRLGNQSGIGRADVDNGVLLVVAPNERKVRIEVGLGLGGLLTDERAAAIIDTQLLPRFRHGRMEEGIRAGVEHIIGVLESSSVRPIPKQLRKAA